MVNVIVSTRKKFFRGKTIEELSGIGIREFSKLLKSRPRRLIQRNFDFVQDFVNRCKKKVSKNKPIKTHLREIVIVPDLVGMTINVYNGKEFSQVKVNEEMLGHRLGEFSMTRKPVKHGAAGIGSTRSSASKSVK